MKKYDETDFVDPTRGNPDLVRATALINAFFFEGYDDDEFAMPDYSDLSDVCLFLKETPDKKHWVQVDVDLENYIMKRYYDWQLTKTQQYDSLYDMNKLFFEKVTVNSLMDVPEEEIRIANEKNYYDCIDDIVKIVSYDDDANPEIFSAYSVDCVEESLASMINRLPEGGDVKFDPQNRVWAKNITDKVWQTPEIDFEAETLNDFTEFVKDYEQGEIEDAARDVVKYKKGLLDDPIKKEIYEFTDSLDRLQIYHDIDKYCDEHIDPDDNMEKFYNMVTSHNTDEIASFLNKVLESPLDPEEADWASLLLKQMNNIENGHFRREYDKEGTAR